eukprot:m.6227 g.6227  ORF g.6227 m.6227 type:complete len:54 (+) comp4357_c0_seq1:247-408(+)
MRHFCSGLCRRQLTQTMKHFGLSNLTDIWKESVMTWCKSAQLPGSKRMRRSAR